MKKIQEFAVGAVIIIGLLGYLYFHKMRKMYFYTGEWNLNLLEYYEIQYGKYLPLVFLIIVVFAYILLKYNKKK